MSFSWPWAKGIDAPDAVWHVSEKVPGVRFAIRLVSVGSRLDLMMQLRDLLAKHEFLKAGSALDQTDGAIAELMAKQLYLRWGVRAIEGLRIGGKRATIDTLIDAGSEVLCDEIVSAIREELELSEADRKNS